MIAASNLSKRFGKLLAVEDVSFSLAEGENLVLLGTSGSGKTTTLRMLNRLIEPTTGSVTVNGENIYNMRPELLRRSMGYVLQQNSLFPHYTVAENIAIVPGLLHWHKARITRRTEELMHRLQLPANLLSAYPRQLSGGQQQRVNIARALAADPPILLMDEPFGALDNVTRANISKDFSEITEFMQKTIIMVTHNVPEAFLIGDTIALMHNGRIAEMGSPKQLLFQPKTVFAREFFARSYTRLAMGLVSIGEIIHDLVSTPGDLAHTKMFEYTQSVWEVLDYCVRNSAPYFGVQGNNGTTHTVATPVLFRAFSEYLIKNSEKSSVIIS